MTASDWNTKSTGDDSKKLHPILAGVEKFVVETASEYVQMDEAAVKYLAGELVQASAAPPLSEMHWLAAAPAGVQLYFNQAGLRDIVRYLTIFHTIGFCYWGEPRWTYSSYGTSYDGSLALLHSLRENLPSLLELSTAQADRQKSLAAFTACLGGRNVLNQIEKRHQFFSDLLDLMEQGVADKPLEDRLMQEEEALAKAFWIGENLPGFADMAPGKEGPLYFFKRAQILSSDIDFILRKRGHNGLSGVEKLTAFADYKLPQLLREAGVLIYSEALSAAVDNKIELVAGSPQEIAIRAQTIVAVEKLKEFMALRGLKLTAAETDNLLWLKAQRQSEKHQTVRPYHRTLTHFY